MLLRLLVAQQTVASTGAAGHERRHCHGHGVDPQPDALNNGYLPGWSVEVARTLRDLGVGLQDFLVERRQGNPLALGKLDEQSVVDCNTGPEGRLAPKLASLRQEVWASQAGSCAYAFFPSTSR
jgi:hypothetical protein